MSRYLLISGLCVCAGFLLFGQGGPAGHLISGPNLPTKCNPRSGDVWFKVTTTPTGTVYYCDALNHWTLFGSGSAGPTGPTGASGPTGPTGSSGSAGATGPTGPSGTAGSSGTSDILITFDGGGLPVTGPTTRCRTVTSAGTIQGVYLIADQSGSIIIDVTKVAFSSYTGPGSASSITASATPSLSSAAKYSDTTLTGWTTSISANDVVCFAMSSPTTVLWAQIILKVR